MKPTGYLGWAGVALVLLVFSDIPQTGQLAVAFAYLILLAVLMSAGPIALDKLTKSYSGSAGQ